MGNINVFVGGSRIAFVRNLKCLGIIIDDQLNFSGHIDHLYGKLVGIMRRFYSCNIYLPRAIRHRLVYALLMPHVIYGLEVFAGTLSYNIVRLNRIVNMIVRYAYNVRRHLHISEYVKSFLGCSFRKFISFRNLLTFYHVIKTGLPSQLCSVFSFCHSTRNPQILIPMIRSSIFERSFIVRVARCWNSLPYMLRIFSHSNNAFRLKLLHYFAEI